jgi:hypothetical protein
MTQNLVMDQNVQNGLFSANHPAIALNNSVDPIETPRLSKQCVAILERLKSGPATNAELSVIALRYSARIGELKNAGHRIEIAQRNSSSGLNLYRLVS